MARVVIKTFISIKQISPKKCKYSVRLYLYIDISYIVKIGQNWKPAYQRYDYIKVYQR